MSALLPVPTVGDEEAWVREHLADLVDGQVLRSPAFRGGQAAADAALAAFDVTGYAADRNEVYPEGRRGASRLSPYIRHGLISLPRLWSAVAGGPTRDVSKFRDELLWQEYARHLYARAPVPLNHRWPSSSRRRLSRTTSHAARNPRSSPEARLRRPSLSGCTGGRGDERHHHLTPSTSTNEKPLRPSRPC